MRRRAVTVLVHASTALGCLVAADSVSASILAGPPCRPGEVRAGWVYERSRLPGVSFVVNLTDAAGNRTGAAIPLAGMPDGMGGTQAKVFIDKSFQACDAINDTIIPPPPGVPPGGAAPGGARAVLWLETIYFDPALGEFYLGSNFDAIFDAFGPKGAVRIPDLYADTNLDLMIGPGDVLYSLVDLADYMPAVPAFDFGDVFSIVNGQVPGLPGMYFSTTDFVISPSASAGFDWTPYTGDATVLTDHTLQVPEPHLLLLMALAAARVVRGRRR